MADDSASVSTLHLRFGWLTLLLFAALGVFLESLHGFRVQWYLDVGTETRRVMWRLAHAHGTFLSLVHIAFALTLRGVDDLPKTHALGSRLLRAASLVVPGGFFLGGTVIYDGDPGLGILLLPIGAALLLVALLSIARGLPGK